MIFALIVVAGAVAAIAAAWWYMDVCRRAGRLPVARIFFTALVLVTVVFGAFVALAWYADPLRTPTVAPAEYDAPTVCDVRMLSASQ